jgi:hypothetical protein
MITTPSIPPISAINPNRSAAQPELADTDAQGLP